MVEKVLDKGLMDNKRVKYLIKWKGHEDTTWEYAKPSFQTLIDAFEASIKKPRKVNLAKK